MQCFNIRYSWEVTGKKVSKSNQLINPKEQKGQKTEIDKFARLDGLFAEMFPRQRAAGSGTDGHSTKHSATTRDTCRICVLDNDTQVFNQEEPDPAFVPKGAVDSAVRCGESPHPAPSSQTQSVAAVCVCVPAVPSGRKTWGMCDRWWPPPSTRRTATS